MSLRAPTPRELAARALCRADGHPDLALGVDFDQQIGGGEAKPSSRRISRDTASSR